MGEMGDVPNLERRGFLRGAGAVLAGIGVSAFGESLSPTSVQAQGDETDFLKSHEELITRLYPSANEPYKDSPNFIDWVKSAISENAPEASQSEAYQFFMSTFSDAAQSQFKDLPPLDFLAELVYRSEIELRYKKKVLCYSQGPVDPSDEPIVVQIELADSSQAEVPVPQGRHKVLELNTENGGISSTLQSLRDPASEYYRMWQWMPKSIRDEMVRNPVLVKRLLPYYVNIMYLRDYKSHNMGGDILKQALDQYSNSSLAFLQTASQFTANLLQNFILPSDFWDTVYPIIEREPFNDFIHFLQFAPHYSAWCAAGKPTAFPEKDPLTIQNAQNIIGINPPFVEITQEGWQLFLKATQNGENLKGIPTWNDVLIGETSEMHETKSFADPPGPIRYPLYEDRIRILDLREVLPTPTPTPTLTPTETPSPTPTPTDIPTHTPEPTPTPTPTPTLTPTEKPSPTPTSTQMPPDVPSTQARIEIVTGEPMKRAPRSDSPRLLPDSGPAQPGLVETYGVPVVGGITGVALITGGLAWLRSRRISPEERMRRAEEANQKELG